MKRAIATQLALMLFGFGTAEAQVAVPNADAHRVAIKTAKGETIEGLLVGLSSNEAPIERGRSASQSPEAKLLAIDPNDADAAMRKAFDSLDRLHSAIEVGLLRPQYADKLQETLPPVIEFMKTPGPWPDVRLALANVVQGFQNALNRWEMASIYWQLVESRERYARALATDTTNRAPTGDSTPKPISVGDVITSRLGTGDGVFGAGEVGGTKTDLKGSFVDVYVLRVDQTTKVSVSMNLNTCAHDLSLREAAAPKKRIANASLEPPHAFQRDLKPGTYQLWAGANSPGCVGEYRLEVRKLSK